MSLEARAEAGSGRQGRDPSGAGLPTDRSVARSRAERRLVQRVYRACHATILEACVYSSVPQEFLGALTANESGGDPRAVRFEPSVYDHLRALASGSASAYGGIRARDLDRELREMLQPKAAEFHAHYLAADFGAKHREEVAASSDEALRELATSWGLTQIMGYHMVGRAGTVRDLLDPRFHYRLALQLLSEFADRFQLDLSREFDEMFRCWNTGSPYGATFDPHYTAKGLRRMELYREIAKPAANAEPPARTEVS